MTVQIRPRVHFGYTFISGFPGNLTSDLSHSPRTHDTTPRRQRRTKNIKSGRDRDEKKNRSKKKGRKKIVTYPHPADVPRE